MHKISRLHFSHDCPPPKKNPQTDPELGLLAENVNGFRNIPSQTIFLYIDKCNITTYLYLCGETTEK